MAMVGEDRNNGATTEKDEQMAITRAPDTLELLVFRLGAQHYVIDIDQVLELRDYSALTRLAAARVLARAMLTLHGAVLPLLDLRLPCLPEPAPGQDPAYPTDDRLRSAAAAAEQGLAELRARGEGSAADRVSLEVPADSAARPSGAAFCFSAKFAFAPVTP